MRRPPRARGAAAGLSAGALALALAAPARGQETTLVGFGSPLVYLENRSDPGLGLSWTDPAFDDSGWSAGVFGVGYESSPPGCQALLGSTVGAGAASVYARARFDVADAAAARSLVLGLDYDDGVVVWLNGTEIHRTPEMPAGPPGWSTPAADHESSNAAAPRFEPWADVSGAGLGALRTGTNVLAVGVWNSTLPSSDLVVVPHLRLDVPLGVARGPYLQAGSATGVTVRWRTTLRTDTRVRYGLAPGLLDRTALDPLPTTEHELRLAGLLPGTRYVYAIGSSAGDLAGDDDDHAFVTAPAPGAARPLRAWVVGDSGTADARAAAVRDAYERFARGAATDLWIMLGDNAYPSGTDAEYERAVFDLYPERLRTTVLWPTLGNHDAVSASSAGEAGPYYDAFTLPRAAEAGGLPSGTEAYYSFDWGNVHFICLDSQESDRSPGGAMMAWLAQDAAATTRDWLVAFWHHPPYSKGSHDSDVEAALVEMRENALPLLEAAGVDLVLAGHSHSYERSVLLDGHYDVSPTLVPAMVLDPGDGRPGGSGAYRKPALGPVPRAGAVYAVAGSSGRTDPAPLDHPAMVVALERLGSLVLEVNGGRLDARFLDDQGNWGDSFTILKGSAASLPPESPSGLSAAARAACTVELSWTDRGDNEDAYRIERSADGRAFAAVGTAGADATAWSDASAAPATAYLYRVVAVNANGPSLPSAPAAVTTLPDGPPAAVGTLRAARRPGGLELSWTAPAGDRFNVRSDLDPAGRFDALAGSTAALSLLVADPLEPAVFYRVAAENACGEGTR